MTPQPAPEKQISQKQLAANRRNAQRCTGPKTRLGKIRSSQNAIRHGLTGQLIVMSDDDREAFNQFSERLLQSLAPEGELELQLAHRIVKDNWRLNRAGALEDNLFALGDAQYRRTVKARDPQTHDALTAARTFSENGKDFQLLTLYEQRINRNLHKNMALLRELQTERKAARENQMNEAQALLQVSAINGLTYDPAKDGFVFSNAEIVAAIDRAHRLEEAQKAKLTELPRPGRLKIARTA